MHGMILVIVMLSYGFLISEVLLLLVKRSKQKTVKKRGDRGSLVILWIAIASGLTIGFNLARYETWQIINYIFASLGILVFIAGSVLRWISIIQLKRAFTVDVAINLSHNLKTDGLYGKIRHPSYLGLLMIMTGLSLGMNSFISACVVTIPVFVSLLYRISVEEKILENEFGTSYAEYIKGTKKILPYIY